MIRTELFKLRHHRTPLALMAILATSVSIAPIYFAIRNPAEIVNVTDTFHIVFGSISSLLAAILGGWILGHEYRQGTLRRVVGSDARRRRLIVTKAGVGLGTLFSGMTIAAAVGAAASLASVSSFGESLVWDGVFRQLLSGGFYALVTGTIAFGMSMLLRSDTYAMLGALAVMIIVGPLLSLVPVVGKYMPSALADDISNRIGNVGEMGVDIVPASLVLAGTIGTLVAAGLLSFERRDI